MVIFTSYKSYKSWDDPPSRTEVPYIKPEPTSVWFLFHPSLTWMAHLVQLLSIKLKIFRRSEDLRLEGRSDLRKNTYKQIVVVAVFWGVGCFSAKKDWEGKTPKFNKWIATIACFLKGNACSKPHF